MIHPAHRTGVCSWATGNTILNNCLKMNAAYCTQMGVKQYCFVYVHTCIRAVYKGGGGVTTKLVVGYSMA